MSTLSSVQPSEPLSSPGEHAQRPFAKICLGDILVAQKAGSLKESTCALEGRKKGERSSGEC